MIEKAPLQADKPNARRRAKRAVPAMADEPDKVFTDENLTATDLADITGMATEQAAKGLIGSAIEAMGIKSVFYRQFIVAMYAEEEPESLLEAMLLTQMGAVHVAATKVSMELQNATNPDVRATCAKVLGNLTRTFADQMITWKKYRAKASQVVRVERVTVHDGGQAIVGNPVIQKGGEDEN